MSNKICLTTLLVMFLLLAGMTLALSGAETEKTDTDSDFNPCQPLNLANSPPFLKILPRCPSTSPASRGVAENCCGREPG